MDNKILKTGTCSFELLRNGDDFTGIGRVWIGDTLVRSGRLPWRPMFTTYTGLDLAKLKLLDIEETEGRVAVRLQALFRPSFIGIMPDHSIDPIHYTADWNTDAPAGDGELKMVFEPATDEFGGVGLSGFAFHYEYTSENTPLFFIYDMCSWELGGDITGATAVSQSSCSDPVARFDENTAWSTEGILHFADDKSIANPVMTHNLPRFASHQSFDYQHKGDATLVGVWERVDLIRTVLQRDAGKPELKTFDKYLFDQTLSHKTVAKKILLNTQPRSEVGQQNLWTWVMQEVHDRARAEFGLREQPLRQRLTVNYWRNFHIDSYYKDLLPAAKACGFKYLFIDNMNKSDETELTGMGNQCCSHQFETAPRLGGPAKLKQFVEDCSQYGITPFTWTNPSQSSTSPLFRETELSKQMGTQNWFVRTADTRSPYCGAYIPVGCTLDLSLEAPRNYWTGCLKKIARETGMHAYMWDSFYNINFMPVTFTGGVPRTVWRGALAAMKDMQDAGLEFMIESFGPFGEVQHGCPTSYNLDNLFACYKVGLGTGYTTVPSGSEIPQPAPYPVPDYYRILAYMSKDSGRLFYGGKRVDELFTEDHKRVLRDYNENQDQMSRRYLQEGDTGVVWHNAAGDRATLWNFADRTVSLPGRVHDLTTGEALPKSDRYHLEPCHTYAITGTEELPVAV